MLLPDMFQVPGGQVGSQVTGIQDMQAEAIIGIHFTTEFLNDP